MKASHANARLARNHWQAVIHAVASTHLLSWTPHIAIQRILDVLSLVGRAVHELRMKFAKSMNFQSVIALHSMASILASDREATTTYVYYGQIP